MSSLAKNSGRRVRKPRACSKASEIRQTSPPEPGEDYGRLRKIFGRSLGGHQNFLISYPRRGRLVCNKRQFQMVDDMIDQAVSQLKKMKNLDINFPFKNKNRNNFTGRSSFLNKFGCIYPIFKIGTLLRHSLIDHLKLTFVAEKPPPSHVFEQVALTTAEENVDYS